MGETENLTERRNRKIAFEIIYYLKRVLLCGVLFIVYYLVIYNEYYIQWAHNYPIYNKDWFLAKYIKFHDFLDFVFHGIFIIAIVFILFHRQIRNSYNWLKKYSAKE